MKIGELSKHSGLTKRTIDYYTKLGLLDVQETSKSGYRYYEINCLEKLKLIEFYKSKHFTLDEIKCNIDVAKKTSDFELKMKLESIRSKLEEAEVEISSLLLLSSNSELLKRVMNDMHDQKGKLNHSLLLLLRI